MMSGSKNTKQFKPANLLRVKCISKFYGDFPANSDVDLSIDAGEIHALLGENGAGKSTLVKILYGSLQPTKGQIFWKDKEVTIESPSMAREMGIGMVFQHFSLFEALSVGENIAISFPQGKSLAEISKQAVELSHKYGLPLNPDQLVGDLSVGERQRVEIIRCLLQNPELIILDEPTSVLTPQEADNLFETLNILKAEGRSVLFISHRLDEVQRICDKATILRYGEVTGHCKPSDETPLSLAKMMVGENISEIKKKKKSNSSNEVLLEIKSANLSAASQFAIALKDINLELISGQILGVAGVAGNGQSELFDLICGERKAQTSENIQINGKPVGTQGINARRNMDAAFIPEERLGHGAVGAFKLSQNMVLSRHASDSKDFLSDQILGTIKNSAVFAATKRVCDMMDVRKSGGDPLAMSLSGGNLQKYIVGRELDRDPKILIVNQPSWGVDAKAAAHIRQAIIDLAEKGSAILVISQDLDEVIELSDNICVMFHGTLSSPVETGSITREEIGLMMAGGEIDEERDVA